jgi:hypothetical protein
MFKCCYCGEFFRPANLELEHIHPYCIIAKQANSQKELEIIANDTANLTYACGTTANGCNQSKSDKVLFDFMKRDIVEYEKFLENNDAKWLDPTGSGSMTYQPPYKRNRGCAADKPSADDAAYQEQLAVRLKECGNDLRPRLPIGWEDCYFDLDGCPIGPVAAVEECCERAGNQQKTKQTKDEVLKAVLLTASNPYGKNAAQMVTNKPQHIKEICWQSLKAAK